MRLRAIDYARATLTYRLAAALSVALCCAISATSAAAQKIDPPKRIKNVEPIYPPSAQSARVQGDVVIEARIGPDGKVSDAKVVTSIPLLDDAALAAVRQWEYTPAVVDGTPVAVVMTVTVHFSLQEAPPAAGSSSEPLVLDRSGNDWTVRGTPLLDDNLRFWLHSVMRTEPRKELYVHASAASTFGELVDVLSSATAAGTERLYLFVGDGDPKQAVRVWLEPVAQKAAAINVPVSDVVSPAQGSGVPIDIARSGATTSAKASMRRAGPGTVVRVRIDRARTMSDVWDVLRLGAARPVEGFAFAVQLPAGAVAGVNAPVSPQQQREWEKVSGQVSALLLSDKKTLDEWVVDSIPVLEKFVTRNPNVLDAQFKLALAYEAWATQPNAPAESKQRDWERAVRHFAVTADLHDNEDARFVSTWKIAQLYGADALNDKRQAERYGQRLVEEHPSHAESHIFYARTLHDAGDLAGAANALRHGRTVAQRDVTLLMFSLQYLVEEVQADRSLPRETVRALLEEANSVADAIVADPGIEDSLYRITSMAKGMVLDLQAERVATTPQQRLALLIESDRWGSHLDEHKKGSPPPARQLSPVETASLECEALGRWSSRIADEQALSTAIASVQKYVNERPACYATHVRLADLHARAAHDPSNANARAAALERAISELEQVIDLAPTALDRNGAFSQIIDLSGPKELNRPDRIERAARTMVKRQLDDPWAHCVLAGILFRAGRTRDAEKTLQTARKSIKATSSARADMASALVGTIKRENDLPPAGARRMFDEASALLTEAEKLPGGKDDPAVISARIGWLNLSADRFENDPARRQAQRDLALQLVNRLREIK